MKQQVLVFVIPIVLVSCRIEVCPVKLHRFQIDDLQLCPAVRTNQLLANFKLPP